MIGNIIFPLAVISVFVAFYICDKDSVDNSIYNYQKRLSSLKLISHLLPIIRCEYRVGQATNLVINDLVEAGNLTPQQLEIINSFRQTDKTITGLQSIYNSSDSIIRDNISTLQWEVQYRLKKTPKFMKTQITELKQLNNDIFDLINQLDTQKEKNEE